MGFYKMCVWEFLLYNSMVPPVCSCLREDYHLRSCYPSHFIFMIFIAFFTQICEAPLEEASNCHDWEKGCEIVLSWHVFSHTRERCSLTNQQKHTVSDWALLGLQYTKGYMVCFVTNIERSIFNWNLFYCYNVLESPKEQGIHYTRITKKNITLIQDTQLPHTKEILHCDPLDKHWRTMPSHKKFCCGLERKNHETRGSPS